MLAEEPRFFVQLLMWPLYLSPVFALASEGGSRSGKGVRCLCRSVPRLGDWIEHGLPGLVDMSSRCGRGNLNENSNSSFKLWEPRMCICYRIAGVILPELSGLPNVCVFECM